MAEIARVTNRARTPCPEAEIRLPRMIGQTLAAVLRMQSESSMAKRKRNYRREYRRRIARGEQRRCPARRREGMPGSENGPGPPTSQQTRTEPKNRPEDDEGRREPKGCGARQSHRQERLRRYLRENTETTRSGKLWRNFDLRRFRLPIYSQGGFAEVWLSAEQATKAGQYLSAVGRFLPTGNGSVLKPFVSDGVRDTAGKFQRLETRANVLCRLDRTGELSVPEVSKIQGERSPWRNLNAS